MLKELYIKNIAVIDDLRLDFSDGFHIFTGETGAGKSILVESIGLVLGEKAKAPLIRDGSDEAIVEAVFDVAKFRDETEIRFRTKLIGNTHERVHEFRCGHEIEDESEISGLILRENGFETSFGFL